MKSVFLVMAIYKGYKGQALAHSCLGVYQSVTLAEAERERLTKHYAWLEKTSEMQHELALENFMHKGWCAQYAKRFEEITGVTLLDFVADKLRETTFEVRETPFTAA